VYEEKYMKIKVTGKYKCPKCDADQALFDYCCDRMQTAVKNQEITWFGSICKLVLNNSGTGKCKVIDHCPYCDAKIITEHPLNFHSRT
jgi:hypothetical protein